MHMQYNIKKNWLESFEIIVKHPIILMPFIIVAFLEGLSLELLCFSTRPPLSLIANPIIRKFFGESFVHYPGNILILPQLFYYKQIGIYIFFGVFLMAVTVNIFKNLKEGLPVIPNAIVKNAAKHYFSFFIYGVIIVILIFIIRKTNLFIFSRFFQIVVKLLPQIPQYIYSLCLTLGLFFIYIIMQTLVISTVPIIVLEKISILKALAKSIYLGVYSFFTIFTLISLPFLIYLPLTLLKSFSVQLMDKTFPEINLYVTASGIILSALVDCYITICASQFILDRKNAIK